VRPKGEQLLQEYLLGKQTYRQLALAHHCSSKTMQRRLDTQGCPSSQPARLPPKGVVVLDTTYFGRGCGVIVLKDVATGINLFAAPLKQETTAFYQAALKEVQRGHYRVEAIVCDGHRGLFSAFGDIPVQMCQFHQIAIMRRYLTGNPKMPAAKALWRLCCKLTRSKEEDFAVALKAWKSEWESFLNERHSVAGSKRTRYAHPRLRSAFLSITHNCPWLFTFLRRPTLQIPNTTNLIDGHFAELKNKLRNHNGFSREHRFKLVLHFFRPVIVRDFTKPPLDPMSAKFAQCSLSASPLSAARVPP
jgi:hypothetical protein